MPFNEVTPCIAASTPTPSGSTTMAPSCSSDSPRPRWAWSAPPFRRMLPKSSPPRPRSSEFNAPWKSAVAGVGPAAVAAALPRLQPLALTPRTRAEVKAAGCHRGASRRGPTGDRRRRRSDRGTREDQDGHGGDHRGRCTRVVGAHSSVPRRRVAVGRTASTPTGGGPPRRSRCRPSRMSVPPWRSTARCPSGCRSARTSACRWRRRSSGSPRPAADSR